MIHQLKIEKQHFEDVVSGKKTFEVRNNDRNFQEGDGLALNEIDENGVYTDRSALYDVIYVLKNPEYVKEGFVILGIRPCVVEIKPVGTKPSVLVRVLENGSK